MRKSFLALIFLLLPAAAHADRITQMNQTDRCTYIAKLEVAAYYYFEQGRPRDKVVAKISKAEAQAANPKAEVIDGVKVYEKMPEATIEQWKTNHPGQKTDGLTNRPDGLYMQRGELDMMVVERDAAGGKGKIVSREEIKTGNRDTHADRNCDQYRYCNVHARTYRYICAN